MSTIPKTGKNIVIRRCCKVIPYNIRYLILELLEVLDRNKLRPARLCKIRPSRSFQKCSEAVIKYIPELMHCRFCSFQDKVKMISHHRMGKKPASGEKHGYCQNVESFCMLLIIPKIDICFNWRGTYMPERAALSEPNFTFGHFAIIHIYCVRALSGTLRARYVFFAKQTFGNV